MDYSKRAFLRAAAILIADAISQRRLSGCPKLSAGNPGHKAILLIIGGVRHAESFSPEGIVNIPRLSGELLPQAIFYPRVCNEGVTAHFNATSSILTGNWQRVDDWGKSPPTTPTIFEYFRKQIGVAQGDVWLIASNKALTNRIGASSMSGYGPAYGANVVFPKQLLITAVEDAVWEGRGRSMADRSKVQGEIEAVLQGSNYEGLGWTVFDTAAELDSHVRSAIVQAVSDFVHGGAPTTGDEFTYLISVEVMRKFAPALLVIILSDVEVAHFGSYSLHLAGIRNVDRIASSLWREVQANSEYRGRTTMIVVPEFGRDPDGSSSNGFFNHRSNDDSCRTTWMMCLVSAVDRPQTVERPVQHIDLCPTLAALLGCKPPDVLGNRLAELRV
jgi:hypothetical protein